MNFPAFVEILRDMRGHPDRGMISALTMTANDYGGHYPTATEIVRVLETELFEVRLASPKTVWGTVEGEPGCFRDITPKFATQNLRNSTTQP
jgi:hypothetical protein